MVSNINNNDIAHSDDCYGWGYIDIEHNFQKLFTPESRYLHSFDLKEKVLQGINGILTNALIYDSIKKRIIQ